MKPPVVLSFTASLVKLYPIYQGELPYNKLQGYTLSYFKLHVR